ncbi:MAG: hypothetical protein H0T76_13740 [Nannocystis sp.]|nr:hypothetical protein [Nannocystis sp.]MBA3547541.1 hypothetical protein [Nannocystis sp.]
MILKLDRHLFALISALTVIACRGDDPGTTEGASSTSTTSDSASSTVTTPTTTDATTTTGTTGTTGTVDQTTMAPTTDPCADSGGFIDCNGTSSGGGEPLPNGAECGSDADCESMNCYKNMLVMLSVCAECNEDADCVAAGTGTACNLDLATQSIACSDGQNGSTCMSDEACMSTHCDAVIEIPIPGLLPDTCGECSVSDDCPVMDDICSPNFDFMAFSGQKKCVAPGSVENNQLCPSDEAEGDAACMSGHCTTATLMGIVPVNICGECDGDGDCDMGMTCMPAEASMAGLTGSTCV